MVGAGPAGILAAVYLARFRRRVVLFDHGRSRARWIPRTRNAPSYPDGVTGEELLARLSEQLARYEIERRHQPVGALTGEHGAFELDGRLRARRVLLATGVEDRMPGDLEYLWPLVKRGQVRLCPVCDAYELSGRRIGVLARGAHGIGEARFLRAYTKDVVLMTHGEALGRTTEQDITVVETRVRQVIPADEGLGILLFDGEMLKVDALYVGFGVEVRSALASALGARVDDAGYLEVDRRQQTTVPGVYAAGDVVQSLSQISVAFGQAAIAASAINVSLSEEQS